MTSKEISGKTDERARKQQAMIDDCLMLHVLISTRGDDWEEKYDAALKKRTDELLAKGWTPVKGSKISFYPPNKL